MRFARSAFRNGAEFRLPVEILIQPDEWTCGPTCLQALYHYWGEDEPLEAVIARTRSLKPGGTFAVFLACDALRKGYRATIYTYNVTVFDPTWFERPVDIGERLRRQLQYKTDYRLQEATAGYLDFLRLGGELRFVDLSTALIHGILRRKLPIITGLSATYLYRNAREFGPEDVPDDVRGLPVGHFVVIGGYNAVKQTILVLDPYESTPFGPSHKYWISVDRVLGSVLLGIVTHDANLLVVHPGNVAAPDPDAMA